MIGDELDLDFHKKYMASPLRMDYEDRYGKFGYDKFLANYFKDLISESFPLESYSLNEKQMLDLVSSKLFIGIKIELIAIQNAAEPFKDVPQEDDDDYSTVFDRGLIKAVKDFSFMAVQFLANGERYDLWKTDQINGSLTEEYWYPKVRDMFERTYEIRRIELADMAMQFEDDYTPVAVIYDDHPVFGKLCNEAIYKFEYPDYSHKTAHDVFVEFEKNWLQDEIAAIRDSKDSVVDDTSNTSNLALKTASAKSALKIKG